jgi:hypothetical protein
VPATVRPTAATNADVLNGTDFIVVSPENLKIKIFLLSIDVTELLLI